MEKSNSAKIPQHKVPHYLRASTGSCHDLCKYGRRHTLGEEAATKSPLKTVARSSLNKLKSAKTITSIEEKAVKAVRCEVCARHSLLENSEPCLAKCEATMDAKTCSPKQNASPGGKTHLLDSMSRKSEPRKIIKRSVSLLSGQVQVTRREGNYVHKMTRSRLTKLSFVRSSDMRRNRDTEENAPARLSRPKPSQSKTALSRVSKTGAQISVLPVKGRSKVNRVETKASLTEKTKHSVNTETSNNASASVEGDPLQASSPSPVYLSVVDEEVRCSNRNMNRLISDEVQPREENDKTTKTALITILDDFTIPPLQSPPSAKCSSRVTSPSLLSPEEKLSSGDADDVASENVVSIKTGERQSVKKMHDSSLIQSSTATHSDGKYRLPVKLKFRRGTVLRLQPSNSDTPRRLRFRHPQLSFDKAAAQDSVSDKNKSTEEADNSQPNTQPASEENINSIRKSRVIDSNDKYHSPVKSFKNQKVANLQSDTQSNRRLRFQMPRVVTYEGDSRRRTFKKAWGKDNPESTGLSSIKLLLKHHDMQKKKDDKGLFNNVIEETASKLVESRKSKVKALVGAFETVISLQELPPQYTPSEFISVNKF